MTFYCGMLLQSLLLEKLKNGLDLPKDASNREEVFQEIKDKTTAWVAKYRRGGAFQGRPSYRCVNCHLGRREQANCWYTGQGSATATDCCQRDEHATKHCTAAEMQDLMKAPRTCSAQDAALMLPCKMMSAHIWCTHLVPVRN